MSASHVATITVTTTIVVVATIVGCTATTSWTVMLLLPVVTRSKRCTTIPEIG